MSACGVVMRLLVCGGRMFNNMALLHFGMCEVAGMLGPIEIDIPGARVRWNRRGFYNALAGTWRNQTMLDEGKPTAFLAMPGGTGTADMVARCRAAGLQGLVVE